MADIKELFKKKGLRTTPQRELIYRLLSGSKAHPTAEHVYREVRKTFPAISFNTVYKTVRSLEEMGFIQRFNTGENIYRYDANVSPHPHFICLSCGRVDDVDDFPDDIGNYVHMAAFATHCEIKFVNLHFYGYCPECRGSRPKTNTEEEKRNGGPD
ncbi:MAG: transcriptional repressor [Peptococcaceae bacterium]|nr:transcriptional repressor [Peptococcaceae bacterium]